MILKTKKLTIKEIAEEDIKRVLEIYNSSQDFLMFHIGNQEVNMDWLIQEQKEMKDTNLLISISA
ncbi:hypothetical protein [Tissierella praeacuta]|uniref:hypothetical protein n=1 Tax=Tissierella praeacuta TaxID=43131 RepID=UPI001C102E1B|nr:hypothetical protein [Tissierella praeacuta]MBU5257377.1 hypothetical protein [Tissierella praeacuta]